MYFNLPSRASFRESSEQLDAENWTKNPSHTDLYDNDFRKEATLQHRFTALPLH